MTRMSRTSAKVISAQEAASLTTEVVPAPRLARMGGFLIDFLIMLPLLFIAWPLTFVYFAGYSSVFGPGRSLGRAAVRQQLVGKDGEPISHPQVVARSLLRALMWMFVLPFFIDVMLFLFDGRLLVDRMFGTRVAMAPDEVRRRRALRGESERNAITEKVLEEADRWDDRFEQSELDEIAGDLGYGQEDFVSKELDDFEKRLSGKGKDSLVPLDTLDVPPVAMEDLFAPAVQVEVQAEAKETR